MIKGRVRNPTFTNLLSAALGKSKKLPRGLLRFRGRKGRLRGLKKVIHPAELTITVTGAFDHYLSGFSESFLIVRPFARPI